MTNPPDSSSLCQVTFLFAIEAMLKITARGFAGYARSKTDAMDLFVAAMSLSDEMVTSHMRDVEKASSWLSFSLLASSIFLIKGIAGSE